MTKLEIESKCRKYTYNGIPGTDWLLAYTVNSRVVDTTLLRTAKSPAKINYRRSTEINSRYYELSLLRTLTRGPEGVRNKGS